MFALLISSGHLYNDSNAGFQADVIDLDPHQIFIQYVWQRTPDHFLKTSVSSIYTTMCALQECSSIPLLSTRVRETKTFDIPNISPSHQAEISPSSFTDNEYRTGHRGNELSFQSKMLPSDQDLVNIPSSCKEKHMKPKNFFQFPNDCNTYSECNPSQAEIEYLLMNKNARAPFVQEAENIIPSCHKKPLSQRSISDYYLSKRTAEESKGNRVMNILSDVQPVFKPSNFSQARLNEPASSNCENDVFLPTNSNCYSPVTAEECYFPTSEKRNSFSIECEAGMSGLNQDDVEETRNLDERNVYRGCNLNPTVNMKIFDTESLSESGEPGESAMALEINAQRVSDESWFIPNTRHTFSGAELSGSTSAAQLSIASSFGDSNTPTCKICHMPAKTDDPLISPCRCTGTLHYIHCGCLMRWLEICNKRSRKPPACELCKYQFHWHKKFKVRHWQFPHCSWRDKILHTVFVISVMVMIGCAIVTVMCFRQHRGNKTDLAHLELTQSEIITLICGALFFLAFFLAMYVEIKARNTIYKLLVKFIYLNQQWYIDEYDKKGENTVIDV